MSRTGRDRVAVERLRWIAGRIRDRLPVPASIVAREFEISPKTGIRNINFMRRNLAWQIRWDGKSHSFVSAGQQPEPLL